MAVRQRGRRWQADFMLAGQRIREQFDNQAQAQAYELECRAAHTLGKPLPRPTGGSIKAAGAATIGGLIDYCAEHHWRGKKAEAMLLLNARQFSAHVGPKTLVVDALTPAVVDDYVQWRMSVKRNSNATINRHLSSISVLIRNAVRLGHLQAPFELKWKKEPQGRLRYYTQEEEEQLFHTLRLWGYDREAWLVHFLADTGCRLGEAKKLQWRDIDGRIITFVDTKNGSNRSVVATDRVLHAIEMVRPSTGDSPGPWSWINRYSLHKQWQRAVAHVGIKDSVNLHTWRHTCASRLVQRGVDLYRVQKWMGHKNVMTTQRYAHLSPKSMEELASVLNGGALMVPHSAATSQ